MEERVAITGMGVLSSCGLKRETFWANLKRCKSFVDAISRFDASLYPSRL